MTQATRIVFFSDVHIGLNAATNWYQRQLHEPYLLALFDYLQRQAGSIHELVLVGDLVDQWTYEPSVTPPTFAEIAAANPRVFGGVVDGQRLPGALASVVEALEGRVTYVGGNHDMSVTPEDLCLVRDSRGRSPQLVSTPLYAPPLGGGAVVCTHGHHFSLLNAPDFLEDPRGGIPFAHFITRLAALWTRQQLATLPAGSTAAALAGGGDPVGWPLAKDLLKQLIGKLEDGRGSLSSVVLASLLDLTRQGDDLVFQMLDGTRPSAADVVRTYASVFQGFEQRAAQAPDLYGPLAAEFALGEVDVLNSITHFARRVADQTRASVVVMGHTHVPVDEDEHQLLLGDSVYANCGFNCPSEVDLRAQAPRRYCTFTEVERDEVNRRLLVSTRYVTHEAGRYQVAPEPLTPPKSIPLRGAPSLLPSAA